MARLNVHFERKLRLAHIQQYRTSPRTHTHTYFLGAHLS